MKLKLTISFTVLVLTAVYVTLFRNYILEWHSPRQRGVDIPIIAASPDDKLDAMKRQIRLLIDEGQGTEYSVYIKPIDYRSPLVINAESMRSASMIKIFIMIEAFHQNREGIVSFEEHIPITQEVKVGGSGSLQSEPDGTSKKLRELVELMITQSDNTATNIVIEKLGIDNINSTIKALGCKDTVLQRKMMDFKSAESGRENYTSVTDLAVVLEKIHNRTCLDPQNDTEMLEILKRQEDNDKIPALLPEGTVVAHKTGELVGAIHDGGIVQGKNGSYVICVMAENVKDPGETVNFIAKISKVVYDQLD